MWPERIIVEQEPSALIRRVAINVNVYLVTMEMESTVQVKMSSNGRLVFQQCTPRV